MCLWSFSHNFFGLLKAMKKECVQLCLIRAVAITFFQVLSFRGGGPIERAVVFFYIFMFSFRNSNAFILGAGPVVSPKYVREHVLRQNRSRPLDGDLRLIERMILKCSPK